MTKKWKCILFSSILATLEPVHASHPESDSKWDYSLEFRVVRCFRMENVKISCDSYTIPGTRIISAELKISARDANGKKFAYGYGKSIEGNLCNEHIKRIRKVIKNQDQICIGGDGENVLDTGETYSRWQELETKLGKVTW